MTSEIRANTLKNRVGLGTISFTDTGPVVSGIVTIANSTTEGVTLEDNAGVGNSLKITTPTGYVSIGSGNSTFVHLNTDRGIFYFQKRITVDEGIISSYDENLILQSPVNTNRIIINKDTGLVSVVNDLDVDGHTNLDNVSIAGITTTTETIRIQGDNKYLQVGASNQIGVVHTGGEAFITNSSGHFTHRSNVHKWENFAGSSEYLRITSAGKIGVDNNNPANKVSIYDVGYCGLELKSGRTTGTDNIGGLHWKNASNQDVAYLQSLVDGSIKFRNTTSLTERLRIDSSGRMGLGITPTDYHSNNTAVFQLKDGNAIFSRTGGTFLGMFQNIKYNSSDVTQYVTSNPGSAYFQAAGEHKWYTASSGTANNNATLYERLRIDTSGRLLIAKGDSSSTTSQVQIGDPIAGYSWNNGDIPQVLIAGVNNEAPSSGTLNIALRVADENNGNMFQIHNRGGGNSDIGQIYVGGKLGINEINPDRAVHIKDSGQIKLENTSTSGWVGLDFLASSGTNNWDAYMGILDSNGNFFIDNNSNGNDFEINRFGVVRMPNQPQVRTRGSFSSSNWNGYKQIVWATEDEDVGGNFSNGVFTVPTGGAGVYVMSAQFIGPANAGQFVLWSFFKNTTALNPWVQIYNTSTNQETGAAVVSVSCAAGDTLRTAWHGSYSTPYDAGYNTYAIFKVH